jgi:general secretion pathway protein G
MPKLAAGYTLLELLVVMLALALVTGLAFPRLQTLYQRMEAAYQRDDVFARLADVGYQVLLRQREFELSAYPFPPDMAEADRIPLELPEGWRLSAQPPVRFRANGACGGGEVALQYQSQRWQLKLKPPYCVPELASAYQPSATR